MQSLKQFIDTFIEVSEAHNLVNSAGTGENADIAVTGSDLYPRVWLDQPFTVTVSKGIQENNLRFYVLDYENDPTLWNDRISSAMQIGQEIVTYLRLNYKNTFFIDDTYNITTFTEFSDDSLCGCLFEVTVTSAINVNRCDVESGLFDL